MQYGKGESHREDVAAAALLPGGASETPTLLRVETPIGLSAAVGQVYSECSFNTGQTRDLTDTPGGIASSKAAKILRICLVASSRFPVAEPFAGGLESQTYALARGLADRGHAVTLFAAPGSDVGKGVEVIAAEKFEASPKARADVGAPAEEWMREHHSYLGLMLDVAGPKLSDFDLIHNNSLHHLPIAMSSAVAAPMVTTLHTPPTPWLESASRYSSSRMVYTAVSKFTSDQWAHVVQATVIPNGIDVSAWRPGNGGSEAVWFGRIVPEKGLHLAIAAAKRAGFTLNIAGPKHDPEYFDAIVRPHLGNGVNYVGHLTRDELRNLVGASAVTLVTPCWDEPFGLVAAESMAAGTPVAAINRGGLAEFVSPESGRLAPRGNIKALSKAIGEASQLCRSTVRQYAAESLSVNRMITSFESLYLQQVLMDSDISS